MKRKTILVRSLCIHIEENFTLHAHLICILFAMMIMGMTSLFAQPANDDCSTAIVIACGDTLSGTTIDGLPDAVDVCGTSATAPGVFYTFIGTGENTTVSLCSPNTNFDTKLSVFEGDCAALVCVDGNDDNCGLVSEVSFTSVAGTVYFFYVHGFSSETGNFDISVTCGGGGGGSNDECANAIPVTCGETVDGSTTGATLDAAPTCGAAGITAPGLWYSFIGTGEQIELSTCGTASYDTKISVFTDGCGVLTCVGSNDDGPNCPGFTSLLTFVSTPGVEYLILIHGYQAETGDFSLSVSCSPAVPAPPNDNCADVTPTELTNGTSVTFTGTTLGATASLDEASVLGAASVWEAVTLTGTCNNLTIDYCGTTPFPGDAFIVYTDCPVTDFTVGSFNLTSCGDGNVTVSFFNLPAGTYYLPVLADAAFVTLGDYTMNVSSVDCPPPSPNDLCSDAVAIFCGDVVSGNTFGTTVDAVTGCDGLAATAPGIWYSFTGTGEFVTLSTCGTASYDTKISVFTDGCGTLSCVAENDDGPGCAGFSSTVGFSSQVGVEYLILVHGYNAIASGIFDMSVSCVTPLPNEFCSDVTPTEITNGSSVVFNGTTEGAVNDPADDAEFLGFKVVWEAFTVTGACNNISISYCGSASQTFNIFASLYLGCPPGATFISDDDGAPDDVTCGDGNRIYTFSFVPAGTYYIPVFADPAFLDSLGSYTITVSSVDCPPSTVANDSCVNATPVACGQVVQGTTIDAQPDGAGLSPCGTTITSPGVWYVFAGTGDLVTVSTCNTADFDTKISVFTGDCGALTCVGGNDDGAVCSGFTSQFTFLSTAGTDYFILIHGFFATGNFDLSVTCTIPLPNDNCSDVVPVTLTNGTPVTFTGTTVGASASPDEANVLGAAAVWEAVILTGECNNLTVDYCGTTPFPGDAFIVYTDCPVTAFTVGAFDLSICPDGNVTISFINLPAGTYYLPVLADEAFVGLGDYTMNVLSEDCPPAPVNDDCSSVVPVVLTSGVPVTFTGTTVGARASAEETAILGAAAVWEAVILRAPCNNLTVDYCGTNPIPENGFIVYTDCPVSGFTIGAFDLTTCPDGNMTVTFNNLPAGTYYLPVLADAGFVTLGNYTMNVTATDYVVTGYTLVNSTTDQDIGPLQEGDIINLNNFPPFTIRTDVCHPVGSMKLDLNGVFIRNESAVPYSLTGDAPTGNYRPWNPSPGAYQLTSTPYSGANGTGTQVEAPSNVNFTVIDDANCSLLAIDVLTDLFGEETSWELADLTDNTIVASAAAGSLDDGTLFHSIYCVPSSHCYEFRIFDAFGDGMCCAFGEGSYKVTFAGNPVASGGEFGASEVTGFGNCDLDCADVVGGAVYSFTLVAAQSDLDIGPLNDGDVIDLALTGPISIRANVCSDDSVGSVKFFVNESLFKIENLVFYSIAGDNNGNYSAWNAQPGVYTVTAIPYSNDNGTGTEGTEYTVTITIVNSSLKTGALAATAASDKVIVNAFPNPFKDNLTFEFSVPNDSQVSLELFSISGVKIATVFEGKVTGGELNQKIFTAGKLASGMYMYRLKSNDSVITERVTLAR